MNTNNTIVYPKIQAIETTAKSKKSSVLTGIGFALFVGGLALNYFGMSSQFGYGHVPGIMVIIVAFIVFAKAQRLAPSCEFPEREYRDNDPDKTGPLGWSVASPFHSSRY